VGSNPDCGDHIYALFIWIKSMEVIIEWKLTWHCYICWNPAKKRVDFEFRWLIKSSFIKERIK
jgi:hypothetical protein